MIRLARTGAKKKPYYRVVVIEKANARDGRFVEIVGHYNPRTNPVEVVLKRDRIDYWLSKGAQPSDTVRSLLSRKEEPKGPQEKVA
jgi:small subunit ribosomal protein S16